MPIVKAAIVRAMVVIATLVAATLIVATLIVAILHSVCHHAIDAAPNGALVLLGGIAIPTPSKNVVNNLRWCGTTGVRAVHVGTEGLGGTRTEFTTWPSISRQSSVLIRPRS